MQPVLPTISTFLTNRRKTRFSFPSEYRNRFVIYNADGTRFGEIKYIIGHALGLVECSACSITHTSSGEKQDWKNLKGKCQMKTKIVQWHRDELSDRVKAFVDSENVEYPVVIVEDRDSSLSVGQTAMNLNCAVVPSKDVRKIEEKQIILIPRRILPTASLILVAAIIDSTAGGK